MANEKNPTALEDLEEIYQDLQSDFDKIKSAEYDNNEVMDLMQGVFEKVKAAKNIVNSNDDPNLKTKFEEINNQKLNIVAEAKVNYSEVMSTFYKGLREQTVRLEEAVATKANEVKLGSPSASEAGNPYQAQDQGPGEKSGFWGNVKETAVVIENVIATLTGVAILGMAVAVTLGAPIVPAAIIIAMSVGVGFAPVPTIAAAVVLYEGMRAAAVVFTVGHDCLPSITSMAAGACMEVYRGMKSIADCMAKPFIRQELVTQPVAPQPEEPRSSNKNKM